MQAGRGFLFICSMKNILLLLLSLTLVACDMNKNNSRLININNSKYRRGEEYSFQARSFEPNARLVILKVEHQEENGNIIHVRVDSVKIKTSEHPVNYSTVITHMPFSETALDASGLKKIGEVEKIPDYQEGYNEWRTSFDQGKAGIFTIPVGKAIDYMQETMLKGRTIDK